ncbi:hypothetical protein TcasGA2_TC008913 [Tribolium castaneum]|uniref:Uncharacterized protein n=1 Tax=Tribolium castaneum TaxID=7070 RepID=D6WQG4_TRICA|nr:hypothetical protein TcasGA2_TC008913 [Tribolium castaneum]
MVDNTDNLEVGSTASSNISESLRAQILGRAHRRTRHRPTTGNLQHRRALQNVVEADESFEIVPQGPGQAESYHTAEGDAGSRALVAASADNVPKTPSAASNRASAKRPPSVTSDRVSDKRTPSLTSDRVSDKSSYTIQTQTVAIQVGFDSDTECCCGDYEYEDPHECCRCRRPEESSDCTETSYQTPAPKRRTRCTCRCRKNRRNYESPESLSDILSDSNDSVCTEFMELPYQNNEEYYKLLKELEKKLIARNKERVRRTMMEFEKRSRQNQNLEKPVCHYEDSPKMGRKKHKNSICCKCGRNKRTNSDILQNEKQWEDLEYCHAEPEPAPVSRTLKKCQWRIDPRTGEWVKVSFQQSDLSAPCGDCDNTPVKKECCCRKKRH